MNNKVLYMMASALLLFTSCDDFLDKDPDNRVYLDTPEAVSELLVTAYPAADFFFAETMSDNAGDRGYNAVLNERYNEQPYFWEDCSDTYQSTPTWFWMESYKAISAANHALEAIEKFEKEGRGDEVRSARGEALICRAYAHFMLANIFCMPYNPATADSELGIPYATVPETTLNPLYKRGTLAETYAQIEDDMLEGLDLIPASYAQAASWHFTRKAAYAFASRYYLWKGGLENIQKSKEYADLVLGDIHTIDPSAALRQMNDSESDYLGDYYDAQKLYTSSDEPANLLLVACMSMLNYQPYFRYALSVDVKYQLYEYGVFGIDWAYRIYGSKDYISHRPLWSYYFLQSGLNAETGYLYASVPLFTMEEVLFNRAEANALMGNYEEALKDMNSFLKKRLDLTKWDGSPITSEAVMAYYRKDTLDMEETMDLRPYYKDFTQQPSVGKDTCYSFVKAILHLRRAEFQGTGLRWFDVRRYDIPIEHKSESRGTVTLPSGDRRRAVQIPYQTIGSGVEPNPVTGDEIPASAKQDAATISPSQGGNIINPID